MSFETCKWNDFLTPPQGYRPTDLLLLTYSLHPTALEETLVQSGMTRTYAQNPEELAAHVRCFCQQDRWQDSGALWQEHLYTQLLLAKKKIVAVKGQKGSFHPKLLAILYESSQPAGSPLLRVVVSSRNLTGTSSREAALCLETDCFSGKNAVSWDLLFAGEDMREDAVYQKLQQADFTACVQILFGQNAACEFVVSGGGSAPLPGLLRSWSQGARRFVAVSPFLGGWEFVESFLPVENGRKQYSRALILTNRGISRQLYDQSRQHDGLFRCLGNGTEDIGTDDFLHAKVYAVQDAGGVYHLLVGSANFSENGFNANTELMVHVTSTQVNFCKCIVDPLRDSLTPCTLQTDDDATRPGMAVPQKELTDEQVRDLCGKIRLAQSAQELANLFYQVFREPVAGRDPVDYAVDVLGNCAPGDTEKRGVWRRNLQRYGAQNSLTDAVRPYYQALAGILEAEENQ